MDAATIERQPSATAVAAQGHDEDRLAQFGYEQELRRDWGLAHNFGVSFSIISVITGITTLFSYGLNTGACSLILPPYFAGRPGLVLRAVRFFLHVKMFLFLVRLLQRLAVSRASR